MKMKMKNLSAKLTKWRKNKIVNATIFLFNIIATLFIVAILCVIFVQRFSNNTFTLGGYSVFTVISGSMLPEYKIGDMLLAKECTGEKINVGDNVVYLGSDGIMSGKVITHKVIRKSEKNGLSYFVTKGTANLVEDPEISEEQVYGKVQYRFVILSLLGRIANNSYGFYFIIFVPFVVFAFFEFLDIKKSLKENDG